MGCHRGGAIPVRIAQGQIHKAVLREEAARRTVDVGLFFPAGRPSASVTHGEVFASRFESGYRVWNVAH
jgi:hypothetical protein